MCEKHTAPALFDDLIEKAEALIDAWLKVEQATHEAWLTTVDDLKRDGTAEQKEWAKYLAAEAECCWLFAGARLDEAYAKLTILEVRRTRHKLQTETPERIVRV